MSGKEIRLKGKWVKYLEEWIYHMKKLDELDRAMGSEFGFDERKHNISVTSTTMCKQDIMLGEEFPSFVPNFMLYSPMVERIATDLGLEVKEAKCDRCTFKFFVYKGYEFYEVSEYEDEV